MTLLPADLETLDALLSLARKHGVRRLQCDGVSVVMGDAPAPEPEPRADDRPAPATIPVLAPELQAALAGEEVVMSHEDAAEVAAFEAWRRGEAVA
jgi:hypothetical protein